MVQIFKKANVNFIGYRRIAIGISLTVIAVSIASIIVHRGFNLSIDFAGGTLVQLKFEKPVRDDIGKVRTIISGLDFGQPEVKTIGTVENHELQITVRKQGEGTVVSDEIRSALKKEYPDNSFTIRREEKVGPKIGSELRTDMLIATLLALIAILVYVGFRFNLPFGVAAVIPLFHDVMITIGLFSLLNLEISLPFLAALLTIVGYSLNDTIVIFDRIRENVKGGLRGKKFVDLVNASINQTLSRTVITSLTTLFTVVALYIFGIETIKDFSLALLIGVVVGTYSTIYIASPILIWWNQKWPFVK